MSLISSALAGFGLELAKLDAIATETEKADEPGIAGAAQHLSLRLIKCALVDLQNMSDRIITHSLRVQAVKGAPSIAEASALFAAGPHARLLGARLAAGNATCAIAMGEDR